MTEIDFAAKEKILIAKRLLKEHEEALLKDRNVSSLLKKLRVAIELAEKERIKTGVASTCARCGSLNRDCCGRGIELRYSIELILINLLLGTRPPEQRTSQDSCYFLTPKGCSLQVRDVFCVNFLCRMITDSIPPTDLRRLRELEGDMLDITFRLEERIKTLGLAKI